jgi:hypothetical protein
MSSSSDIEKLFDHFGGDANAYQEIGRENEARSARTRWPLLVTLDLTQPAIPAIGQQREPKPQPPMSTAFPATDRQDNTPRDVAAVTRAKAPLFTRSHRRDIPPVVVAVAPPATPSGASRFGALEAEDDGTAQEASARAAVDALAQGTLGAAAASGAPAASAPVAPLTASAPTAPFGGSAPAAPVAAPVPPAASPAYVPSIAAVPPAASVPPAMPVGGALSALAFCTPAGQTIAPTPPAAPAWAHVRAPAPAPALAQAQAPASVRAQAQAPSTAPISAHTGAYTRSPAVAPASTPPAAPTQPASILGKLFAAQPQPAPPQPAAAAAQSAPLQSVFDRLRNAPAPTPATPAAASRAAASGVASSWLVNGPRRS